MIFTNGLKGVIPPKEAETLLGYDITLDSETKVKATVKYKIDKVNKVVTVYLPNLSPKEKVRFKKSLKAAFDVNKACFIDQAKSNLLDRLYKYNDQKDNQILKFFKPILVSSDWLALRDSLFLRNEFNIHGNVGVLKNDIKARYGERGNTISNLCTAGYFEETMIPLYNESKTEFFNYYDIAIDRGITALFVNATMSVSKIQEEITRRLKSAKSYGLASVHIHGIGTKNIENIKKCIEKEKGSYKFTEKIIFTNPGKQVLVVEIIL